MNLKNTSLTIYTSLVLVLFATVLFGLIAISSG
jgi:uncharacterized membrane protein YidH (DUF202 family)